MCDGTWASRDVWGHAPQEIFVFRQSEIISGAFLGTTLTDKLYCGMGVLEICPCDIVYNMGLLTQFCTVLYNMLHVVLNFSSDDLALIPQAELTDSNLEFVDVWNRKSR